MMNKTNKIRRMNWRIIASNLREAREQLEDIEKQIEKKKYLDEIELQLFLEHAYHHLNFAWNIRRISTKEYANLSDDNFNRWGQFPKDIELPKIEIKRTRKPTVGKQRQGEKEKTRNKRAQNNLLDGDRE